MKDVKILPVISFTIHYYNARFSWVYGINYYGVQVHGLIKEFFTARVSMVSYTILKNSNNK
jgi:hypothetical protein